jgi:epoxyqueuosine reductase
MELAAAIKEQALGLGFDAVGITTAEPLDAAQIEHFQRWLADGGAEGLAFMKRHMEKRFAPAQLLPGAQSVICTAVHYKPAETQTALGQARIARFALYDDYHLFLKKQLRQLAEFIQSRLPQGTRWTYKICVDSVPLAERALAARAGLGFIGKNHMLIHPVLGSQLLLGELITTLPLPPDQPETLDGCGRCSRCLDACPTGALGADGLFRTNRCISYLTQYAHVSDCRVPLNRWIFGCDECLLACPYEQKAPFCQHAPPGFTPERTRLSLEEILRWETADFERYFKSSCVERIGLQKLRQNAAACLNRSDKPDGNTR